MKVLLNQEMDNLGDVGDVVEVADGYARNYLLPYEYASLVDANNLQRLEALRRAKERREQEEVKRIEKQAEDLEGFLCVVEERATETGHLFGSVTADVIASILVSNGFEGVRASSILLDKPIENVGDYPVEVMLLPEVRIPITVRVTSIEE